MVEQLIDDLHKKAGFQALFRSWVHKVKPLNWGVPIPDAPGFPQKRRRNNNWLLLWINKFVWVYKIVQSTALYYHSRNFTWKSNQFCSRYTILLCDLDTLAFDFQFVFCFRFSSKKMFFIFLLILLPLKYFSPELLFSVYSVARVFIRFIFPSY